MNVGVHRAHRLGIKNPDEQAVKWLLALIHKCHYTAEMPTPKKPFNQVNELKELFVSEHDYKLMVLPIPMRTYPSSAHELPASLYNAAYSSDKPPEDRSCMMTGLSLIASGIPLRKNSKLLKDSGDDEFDG